MEIKATSSAPSSRRDNQTKQCRQHEPDAGGTGTVVPAQFLAVDLSI